MKLHPCPETDRPGIQFTANACVATYKNPRACVSVSTPPAGVIGLDTERASRRLGPRMLKIWTPPHSAGVG